MASQYPAQSMHQDTGGSQASHGQATAIAIRNLRYENQDSCTGERTVESTNFVCPDDVKFISMMASVENTSYGVVNDARLLLGYTWKGFVYFVEGGA